MCGIATVAIGHRARSRIPYDKLRALIGLLLVELQPRGMDASGIAVINAAGTEDSWVFKKALMPSRLAVRPRFQETLDKIGPQTNFVLLHARATTVGNTGNNFNNHPIIIPNFVGIHNGTLFNDANLFRQHEADFGQQGEVDSEIIFQLFSHFTGKGLPPREAMQQTTAKLRGAFTGAVVDYRNPERMLLFKYERPLCLVRIPYYDIVIGISESRFFQRAVTRLGIKAQAKHDYVYDRTGLLLDLSKPGSLVSNVEDFDLPIEEEARQFRRQSNWVGAYYTG